MEVGPAPGTQLLGIEQARLAFTLTAALVGLSLDGINLRLYQTVWDKEPVSRLAECVDDALAEEAVEAMERLEKLEIQSKDSEKGNRDANSKESKV